MLPFSREQFVGLFAAYGSAIWPVQMFAYVLGGVAVAAIYAGGDRCNRIVTAVLALMWGMTGVGYHWLFFARINKAAYAFAAMFAIQSALFVYMTIARANLKFGLRGGMSGAVGGVLVAYAIVVYPAIGVWTGHTYLEIPAFGVTPCPTTLFTFGVLLLTTSHVPGFLLVIPGIWSLVGGTAAFLLDIPQDWPLLFSGVTSIAILSLRDRKADRAARLV